MDNLPPFPKRIPEKLKTIREHMELTPDEIAPKVGARTGAEILATKITKTIYWSRCYGAMRDSRAFRLKTSCTMSAIYGLDIA